MTLDDDFNVPDTKPDVSKLIKTGGELKFNEQKMMNGKLYLMVIYILQSYTLVMKAIDQFKVSVVKFHSMKL